MEPTLRHEGHSSVFSLRYSNHKNPVDLIKRKDRRTKNKRLHTVFGELNRGRSCG
ncbi:MAG: hypothetical protein HXS44_06495 [Theionarchaea archaeon]|nr:hypothetical protein [Theionarchaea archaeon]